MDYQQKAVIVQTTPDKARSLDELNMLLSRGWRVVHATPMGGAGASKTPHFAALVILERADRSAAEATVGQEAAEELVEGTVEDITGIALPTPEEARGEG